MSLGDEDLGNPSAPDEPSSQSPDFPSSDSDSDGDTDTDSDTDSDADADTDIEPPWWDTGPNWDTAEDGFGDVSPVCWAAAFGGDRIWIADAAALPDGAIAVAGGYSGDALFGRGEENETELAATPGEDLVDGFLALLEPDGALRWALKIGTVRKDAPPVAALAVLPGGELAIAGAFSGSALLGGAGPDAPPLTATGVEDAYVARYSGSGKLVWAETAGGPAVSRALGLGVLPDGSIALGGHHDGSIVLGLGEPGEVELPAHSGMQPFVALLAPNGGLVWAAVTDGAHAAAELPSSTQGRTLVATWSDDGVFATAFEADGEQAFQIAGSGEGVGLGAAALDDGSWALAGRFRGQLTLPGDEGPVVLGSSCSLEDACLPTAFTALIDAHGDLAWTSASTAGPAGGAAGIGAAGLADGSILVAGTLTGAVGFGDGEPTETWLVASGEAEPYAAIYGAGGELEQPLRLGLLWDGADAAALTALADGGFAVAGTFEGQASLVGVDDDPLELEAVGQRDGYVLLACP